jgi:hypothetical protein
MSIEITDELIELVEEHKHYGTDATARHLAAYICEELWGRGKNARAKR